MDKSNGIYYDPISSTIDILLSLFYQAKRKQALLESNLSGILLMDDKYFKSMGYQCDSPLKYLESFMPLKLIPHYCLIRLSSIDKLFATIKTFETLHASKFSVFLSEFAVEIKTDFLSFL